jgi:lysylphosphatidylglycerol synthetase-like protein (DUF2156 family)
VNEPVTSFPQAALLAVMISSRYHPGQHPRHDGFLQHAFAISPWLGAIVVAPIVLGALLLIVVKKAGRVLEGAPWYARLALLAAAGFGMFRLFNGIRSGAAARNSAAAGPRRDPG